ncbi:hypothetical protein Tco_1300930 [Tanacetum coccineum]
MLHDKKHELQIPSAFDPFAKATAEDSGVRTIKKDFSYNKILKDLKKEFCCNGTFVQDFELGQDLEIIDHLEEFRTRAHARSGNVFAWLLASKSTCVGAIVVWMERKADYQRMIIMGEPLSPESVRHSMKRARVASVMILSRYGPLQEYVGNPNNNNRCIKAVVPLLGKLGAEVDEPMVGPGADEVAEPIVEMEEQGFDDDEEVWEVNEEWLMAPVTPPPMPVVPIEHLRVIEDLSTRMGNLEYGTWTTCEEGDPGTGYGVPDGSGLWGRLEQVVYSGLSRVSSCDPAEMR